MLFWLAIICVTQNGKQENLLIAFRRLNGVRLLVGECRYGLSLTEVPIRRVRTDTLLVKWYRVGKFRFDKIIPFGVCCFHLTLISRFLIISSFLGTGKTYSCDQNTILDRTTQGNRYFVFKFRILN